MTPDEYLKTCTNVPALPEGWHWLLATSQEAHESKATGITRELTLIDIEITDREDKVQGRHRVFIRSDSIAKYPELVDIELAHGCREAYNNLYSELKVSFYKALDLDPKL